MTPEELLSKAADIIATDGHHKGAYCAPQSDGRTGPVCAAGALNRAATGSAVEAPRRSHSHAGYQAKAWQRLAAVADIPPWAIANWNDAPERTAEDVILAFKQAAHMESSR